MATKTIWIIGGIAALVLVGGAVAGGIALMGDDEGGQDNLSVDLAQGGRHEVSRVASAAPRVVEADYELDNTGSSAAVVRLTLSGPDGVLETTSKTVAPGQHVTIEIEHPFASSGAAGTYTATLVVERGAVHLTEGGVDIDEVEDGDDEDEDDE